MAAKRKSVAPQEYGDLPNEQRCKQCMRLLNEFEDTEGKVVRWCPTCGIFYKAQPVFK